MWVLFNIHAWHELWFTLHRGDNTVSSTQKRNYYSFYTSGIAIMKLTDGSCMNMCAGIPCVCICLSTHMYCYCAVNTQGHVISKSTAYVIARNKLASICYSLFDTQCLNTILATRADLLLCNFHQSKLTWIVPHTWAPRQVIVHKAICSELVYTTNFAMSIRLHANMCYDLI